jgi:Protein of unknown function (DUF3616)
VGAGRARHLVLDYRAVAGEMLEGAKRGKRGKGGGSKDVAPIANVSGVALVGDDLWTAPDEGAAIERLKRDGVGYGAARSWPLADLFPAYAAASGKASRAGKIERKKSREADLEGLAFDPQTRRLWIAGSHCRGRGNIDKVAAPALRKGVTRSLEAEPTRTLLGFVTLSADGAPRPGRGLALPFGETPGSLRAAVKAERGHLAEALKWPSKENGLDIEGIAAKGDEVLLGLRGPAAGGFAIVMRLRVKIGAKRLALRKRKGARYSLSFLGLNGLGVRDLLRLGDDVLVLAGPTMDLDAPFALYRWRGAFAPRAGDERIEADGSRLEFLFDLPPRERSVVNGRPVPHERPEGIAIVGAGKLLIVHDRPSAWRLQPEGTLKADLIDLEGSSKMRRPVA